MSKFALVRIPQKSGNGGAAILPKKNLEKLADLFPQLRAHDYGTWLRIGSSMVLHGARYEIFEYWSHGKYDKRQCSDLWNALSRMSEAALRRLAERVTSSLSESGDLLYGGDNTYDFLGEQIVRCNHGGMSFEHLYNLYFAWCCERGELSLPPDEAAVSMKKWIMELFWVPQSHDLGEKRSKRGYHHICVRTKDDAEVRHV